MENIKIKQYIKQTKISFFVIPVILLIFLIVMYLILNDSIHELINRLPLINYFVVGIYVLIIVILAIATTMEIKKLKDLLYVKPIKCIIEDFVYIAYSDDGKRNYDVYPIVKNLDDNKLYFSFGHYLYKHYNTIFYGMGSHVVNKQIYRKDASIVKIGDVAYLYKRKDVDINVRINKDKNRVYLNRKKIYFISDKHDIEIFNNLKFFEGILDIENNQN